MTDLATADRYRIIRARWEMARRDPVVFLRYFVWTVDAHDPDNPIKPFPIHKPHLVAMTRLWQDNRLLSILKCRQVVMTWLFSALSLWDVIFHRGRLVIMQSKRLEDAVGSQTAGDGPLGRAKFIFSHIPMRKMLCPAPNGNNEPGNMGTYDRLEFPETSSILWAIPQGGNIIRQRTASGIFSDEAAFQPECEDAYVASRPCIRGGGWYVSLTTADLADAGHTMRLHEDRLDEAA